MRGNVFGRVVIARVTLARSREAVSKFLTPTRKNNKNMSKQFLGHEYKARMDTDVAWARIPTILYMGSPLSKLISTLACGRGTLNMKRKSPAQTMRLHHTIPKTPTNKAPPRCHCVCCEGKLIPPTLCKANGWLLGIDMRSLPKVSNSKCWKCIHTYKTKASLPT